MKTFAKTATWTLVSGLLFLISSLAAGVPLPTALWSVMLVSMMKTPFYSLHESAWNWSDRRRASRMVYCGE